MNTADFFVRCLENERVRYVFGLPGEEIEDLMFSLDSSKITFVPTRHEQGAAFMADAWGRVTGTAGVCLSTLGPGATNLLTGIADATLDKSPLVAITGQAATTRMHKESHQHLPIVQTFRPIVKWNTTVRDPGAVAEVVRKAFKIAEFEKPGATHIELPEDIAAMPAPDHRPIPVLRTRRADPDRKALQEAARLLRASRKPLVLAGNGAIRTLASRALTQFVRGRNIPVVHTFMGRGAVSDREPNSLFAIGLRMRDIVMDAVDQADLVISVGYDVAEYAPDVWNPRNDKPIVHVDFTPAEVYLHYQPAVEVVADIAASLRELDAELGAGSPRFESWYEPVRARILANIEGYRQKDREPLTVPGALAVLREALSDTDLLISDVGAHKIWIARNYPTYCPNGCIVPNGLASMGFALPAGIAAALADPRRKIVAAMGDGGFLMNSQEIETATRIGAAFTILVFNDNDYGLISWKQRNSRGRSTGTKLTNPDLKKYAESFGISGCRASTPAELREALARAAASGKMALIEAPVSSAVNDSLKPLED